MPTLSIELDEKELKILKKRSKDNLLSIKEQVEDIIRRSCISSARRSGYRPIKCDDKLVAVFSRDQRGRKKKIKKKKWFLNNKRFHSNI